MGKKSGILLKLADEEIFVGALSRLYITLLQKILMNPEQLSLGYKKLNYE